MLDPKSFVYHGRGHGFDTNQRTPKALHHATLYSKSVLKKALINEVETHYYAEVCFDVGQRRQPQTTEDGKD
ncbi:unnamed protein product [Hymenolepis diminuta]|uniref:Transposase n=1 Tax=Hymenolepis diminuta TaxID=6216 RepID=A0A0R3SSI5_HYMDI|nr:unnamed protein product [Hymenolepis diminuta]